MDAIQKIFAFLIQKTNRALNAVFQSHYNPFHLSGTLAIALLIVLIATGIYLLFFFSVSDPYSSLESIQEQILLGRWIRALHRYVTDALIIAAVYHVLQMISQGKTWGPRTLAWVTGCLLLGAILVSTWTGYVMIWDKHGQLLAQKGAEILKYFFILTPAIGEAFSGERRLSGSFIFMNLFLHVAVPLIMFIGIWVHTFRLQRSRWIPSKKTFLPLFITLVFLSIILPAPMTGRADLLSLLENISTDIFSFAWLLPFTWFQGGGGVLFMAFSLLGLVAVPLWFRPNREKAKNVSAVVAEECSGCTQCMQDCPFEAIEMVEHKDGSKKKHSFVNPDLCVSCGICAGSCTNYAIGPPERKGRDIRSRLEVLKKSWDNPADKALVYYCEGNQNAIQFFARHSQSFPHLVPLPITCAGNLHAYLVAETANQIKDSAVWSCEFAECANRLGATIAWERFTGSRAPTVPKKSSQKKITRFQGNCGEELESWLVGATPVQGKGKKTIQWVKRSLGLSAIAAFIFFLSAMDVGEKAHLGGVRLLFKIPSENITSRRQWTEEETENVAKHMQAKEKVERRYQSYRVRIFKNGEKILESGLASKRIKKEGMLSFEKDFFWEPGRYRLGVEIVADSGSQGPPILFDEIIEVNRGKIGLYVYDKKKNTFTHLGADGNGTTR